MFLLLLTACLNYLKANVPNFGRVVGKCCLSSHLSPEKEQTASLWRLELRKAKKHAKRPSALPEKRGNKSLFTFWTAISNIWTQIRSHLSLNELKTLQAVFSLPLEKVENTTFLVLVTACLRNLTDNDYCFKVEVKCWKTLQTACNLPVKEREKQVHSRMSFDCPKHWLLEFENFAWNAEGGFSEGPQLFLETWKKWQPSQFCILGWFWVLNASWMFDWPYNLGAFHCFLCGSWFFLEILLA